MSRRLGPAVVAVLVLAAAPKAIASDATSAQVAALAARAGSDPQALMELRGIDRVDGRPVDLAAALDTEGPALEARLRTLRAESVGGTAAGSAGDPRASARSILGERRFRGSDVPRPLHRPLHWLGEKLRRLFDRVSVHVPGGDPVVWLLIGSAIAALAVFAALQLGRRRGGRFVERGAFGRGRSGEEDPRQLEREADKAEREGDLERALRLRFRAGLLRLARTESLPVRESLTNGEISRRLGSTSFRGLAGDFDEVVYGRRAAAADDVTRAREAWPRVLQEATRR